MDYDRRYCDRRRFWIVIDEKDQSNGVKIMQGKYFSKYVGDFVRTEKRERVRER